MPISGRVPFLEIAGGFIDRNQDIGGEAGRKIKPKRSRNVQQSASGLCILDFFPFGLIGLGRRFCQ